MAIVMRQNPQWIAVSAEIAVNTGAGPVRVSTTPTTMLLPLATVAVPAPARCLAQGPKALERADGETDEHEHGTKDSAAPRGTTQIRSS